MAYLLRPDDHVTQARKMGDEMDENEMFAPSVTVRWQVLFNTKSAQILFSLGCNHVLKVKARLFFFFQIVIRSFRFYFSKLFIQVFFFL